MSIEVFPSLPAPTFAELKSKMEKVRGVVKGFQIDVADGAFVASRSWPLNEDPADRAVFDRIVAGEEALPCTGEMAYEVHFMAHHPETMIADWLAAGATRFLVHVEAEHDFEACVAAAQGAELGISLNIATPLSAIEPYLGRISCVQLMGIATIGVQGQPFDPRVLDRIREVRQNYPDVIIEVDGAVNMDTAPGLVEAGARRLAPGSFVLSSPDPVAAVRALESLPV